MNEAAAIANMQRAKLVACKRRFAVGQTEHQNGDLSDIGLN